jgi:hypothetical protein
VSPSRRWRIAALVILALNLWGLTFVLSPENMGVPGVERRDENHDLRVLVERIDESKAPVWNWFVSDWPLYNGFYRPLPTLSFEVDRALFGHHLNPYKWQNFLIAIACSLLLAWTVWELFRRFDLAAGCGGVFAVWQNGLLEYLPWPNIGFFVALALLAVRFFSGKGTYWDAIGAGSIAIVLGYEASLFTQWTDSTSQSFAYRTTGWPVGRTATMLTLFALIAIGAYARFERERAWCWAVLSLAAVAACFLSYEQSVVVPALLIGSAAALRLQGIRVRWLWHALPLLLLACYILLHRAHIDFSSDYRQRASRSASGGVRDLVIWMFPAYFERPLLEMLSDKAIGVDALLVSGFWVALTRTVANAIAYLRARVDWLPCLFGLIGSVGAYGPLSFQHPLSHYFHLPYAARTVFAVSLALLFWRLALKLPVIAAAASRVRVSRAHR